jgi:phospholipase/lecithinase/hemolysin
MIAASELKVYILVKVQYRRTDLRINFVYFLPKGIFMGRIILWFGNLLLIFAGGASAVASAATYDNLYVFGDSNSDTGVRLMLEGIPAAPYWQGRHSNGAVAVEYLSASLGVTLTPQANTFAVGGATTGLYNVDTTASVYQTGMLSQFANYSNLVGGKADPNALYFIWGGANDISSCGKASCTQVQLQAAVDNINLLVSNLSSEGASNFFIVNSYGGNAGALTFNSMLAADVSSSLSAAGRNITYFDARSVVAGMSSATNPYGFTNTSFSTPCYTGALNGTGGTICANPDAYVAWDTNGHLTAHANDILGSAMAAAVPEPETFAMLLAGLGLIGATVKGRRTKQS